jgi:general secretion pathway protein F
MTLSTLFRNGTPLAVALRIARGTVQNIAFTDVLGRVALAVQGGEPLSTALARTAIFPAVAVQLARVGEETGELEQMLASAATFLEEEAHRRLEGLLVLIVPALTIVMGLVVAVLIGSVLIGLLSINDLAF